MGAGFGNSELVAAAYCSVMAEQENLLMISVAVPLRHVKFKRVEGWYIRFVCGTRRAMRT